jgi:hypothetical protein
MSILRYLRRYRGYSPVKPQWASHGPVWLSLLDPRRAAQTKQEPASRQGSTTSSEAIKIQQPSSPAYIPAWLPTFGTSRQCGLAAAAGRSGPGPWTRPINDACLPILKLSGSDREMEMCILPSLPLYFSLEHPCPYCPGTNRRRPLGTSCLASLPGSCPIARQWPS